VKRVNAAPGARRLIESLRDLGYDCATAIADLVDNSISARASEVHIEIQTQGPTKAPFILIADNGLGMDRERLYEAMRFGAHQEYTAEDLGKYGLGLKTASLSQCRCLTVASKARPSKGSRPRRHFARWDLDHVDATDDWDLLLPDADELQKWELEQLEDNVTDSGGTAVMWTGLEEALPLLSDHNVRKRERFLAELCDVVSLHLRMVFHRFMDGSLTGRRRLRIHLCGQQLEPWDPFCLDESTRELDLLKLPVTLHERDGSEISDHVIVKPFLLPREDEFSSQAAWREASGPGSWNQQQGFYFYRNDRLLQAGGWSHVRTRDEHIKLLRVAVHFPQTLDRAFAINVTKMRARFPPEVLDSVKTAVSKWAKTARERYDRAPKTGISGTTKSRKSAQPVSAGPPAAAGGPGKRGEPSPTVVSYGGLTFALSNAPGHTLTVSPGATAGQLRIVVPHRHEAAAELFRTRQNGKGDLRRLALAILSVLEAVYERRLRPDDIPLEPLRRALRRETE
jgi:hypothetical protein